MKYLVPEALDQALKLICPKDSHRAIKIIAGGTDLAVQIADNLCSPGTLVDLSGIDDLKGIRKTETGIRIGAMCTIDEIASADLPVCLVQGAVSIGSPQIRNMATIGGNICNASPCGDTLTPLIALKGIFVLVSASGRREVEAENFFKGPKKTILNRDEILSEILIYNNYLGGASSFKKIGKRNAQAISQVNIAIWAELSGERKIIDIRAAAGSVAPVPLRLKEVEQLLKGSAPDAGLLQKAEKRIDSEIKPITDIRAGEVYRRKICAALFRDAINEIKGINAA